MNFDLLKRLRTLEAAAAQARAGKTVFNLEDGSQFLVEADPITYLLQYGVKTERGRIVGYKPPPGEQDPITGAVYAEISRQVFGDILAHPVPDRNIHDFE